MRTAIKAAGIASLAFGVIVEILGVFCGSDALQHNAYGWAGGILIVLGAFAIQRNTKKSLFKSSVPQLKEVLVTRD